jgi:hypothetical protein
LSEITGHSERLANNPLLARSIKNRFPYLDPLNHLQVELLKRHRAGDDNVRWDVVFTSRSMGSRRGCAIRGRFKELLQAMKKAGRLVKQEAGFFISADNADIRHAQSTL